MDHARDAAIRGRAYQLWIEGGYADGQQDANWRQAEREIVERERAGEAGQAAQRDTAVLLTMRVPAMPAPHSDGKSFHPSVLDPGFGRFAA